MRFILHLFAPAIAFIIFVSGCTPTDLAPQAKVSKNLVKPANTEQNSDINTYPRIVLRSFQGVPQTNSQPLRSALISVSPSFGFQVDKTGRRKYAYAFTGDFGSINETGVNVISYRWTITDANGQFVHSFLGNLRSSSGTTHPWQGFTNADYQSLANDTFRQFSNWLSRAR